MVPAEVEAVSKKPGHAVEAGGDEQIGPTRELASFVARLRYEDIPAEVITKAKACLLDAVGCMLFGSTLPWVRIATEAALEQGGNPQATLIGTAHRTSVIQAALVNGTAGHAFELDDAHTGASMHAGSVNVAIVLALGEWLEDVSGRDVLTALIAGYESGLRVGMAGAGNVFKRGFHSAAVCGVFAGAATASRLLGLDAERTQHAFGIAGSLAGGLMAAQEGAMVKRLHAGQAARNGVYGALLARRGFTGIRNVLEAPFGGFFSAMTDHHEPTALTGELGSRWETLAVGFKPYATAGAIHASLMLLDTLMREHSLAAGDIERIEVECTTYCKGHVGWPYVPQGVASAQMNMYYALSVMVQDRAAMIEQFREQRLKDPQILEFMRRIHIAEDRSFDELGNAFRYATRVRVITRTGSRHERETLHRPGSPHAPLGADRLREKFENLASYALEKYVLREVAEQVDGLETQDSIKNLTRLLCCYQAVK
jgi:2-methylcitrate dehydratase PrpD